MVNDSSKFYCDLFLYDEIKGGDLKRMCPGLLKEVDTDKSYHHFAGLNLKRLHALLAVTMIRQNGFNLASVPNRYRDEKKITEDVAFEIAKRVDLQTGLYLSKAAELNSSPLFWKFKVLGGDGNIIGGRIFVDKIDGHLWSFDDVNEYEHDYNNNFR